MNLFRRLFAEGAFSAAYVPMFSRKLHGPGGIDAAPASGPEASRLAAVSLEVFERDWRHGASPVLGRDFHGVITKTQKERRGR